MTQKTDLVKMKVVIEFEAFSGYRSTSTLTTRGTGVSPEAVLKTAIGDLCRIAATAGYEDIVVAATEGAKEGRETRERFLEREKASV